MSGLSHWNKSLWTPSSVTAFWPAFFVESWGGTPGWSSIYIDQFMVTEPWNFIITVRLFEWSIFWIIIYLHKRLFHQLSGGIPTPLKIWKSVGWNSQYMENHKSHVPNHQPDDILKSLHVITSSRRTSSHFGFPYDGIRRPLHKWLVMKIHTTRHHLKKRSLFQTNRHIKVPIYIYIIIYSIPNIGVRYQSSLL
jgi:hypothetical protein